MSGPPRVGGGGDDGGKRNGGNLMDNLFSTDNLLAQTRKQTSMRDMKQKSSSPSSSPMNSSAADGGRGRGGGKVHNNNNNNNNGNGLDGFPASSSSTMQADDLDAFFSTQTQTETKEASKTKNGVHQNDSFLDELAAFASTPVPPSSASATTNSSVDDLFGISSDAQGSSPVGAARGKTETTTETQPTHHGEPMLRHQQGDKERAREQQNQHYRSNEMKRNSNDITTDSNRKPARNTGDDGVDRSANFEKSAATLASSPPSSRVQPQQHAPKLASSVNLDSLKTGIDSVAGFFKAGIRRAVGPQVVHFPRAPLEDSAPSLKQAPSKDGRRETRVASKQNETTEFSKKVDSSKIVNEEMILAQKSESAVKITVKETKTKTTNSKNTDERDKNNQKEEEEKSQDDLPSSDMDAFFGSAGARSVNSSTSNSHIDLESMFNSSNAPKSNSAPSPVADDFFGASVASSGPSGSSAIKDQGAFKYNPESDDEQDGDTEQRAQLRKQRHERNRVRIEQALEEKRARERQAMEERAERQTLQDLIGTDIDEWGKKYGGNVRTMLANLSEVLWEDHAYKVPSMMDLMEPIKVKKSYHRALVIIHPDKVAQKGGGASQRFIADKVFDLMKDAYRDFERKEMS